MPYINPHSILAVGIVFPILGAFTVGARFYIRRNRKLTLGLDDWLCLPALAFVTGCGIIMIMGAASHTIGYHSQPKDNAGNDAKIIHIEKLEWAFNIMSLLALGPIKLSILFFYRRIFLGHLFGFFSWSLIILVILWTLGFLLTLIFDCKTHFDTNWGPLSDLERCLDTFTQFLAYSISDVITDVFILVLPLPLVWRMHMPIERKVAVSCIFLLGTLAIVAGILRLVVFAEILGGGHTQAVLVILGVTILDDMAVVSLLLFWPMIEMGVALVVACLPALRPLFRGKSPESAIQSVRSKLSLRSLRSLKSSSSQTKDINVGRNSNDSITAMAHKPGSSDQSNGWMEIHTMRDMGTDRDRNNTQMEGKVCVK